jgi:glycosyltransferase involved in cell wall biosynthesis
MTISFYSNYLNHLQTAFCDEMFKVLGDDFRFISTEEMPADRLNSGYQDCSHYPYNINSFESTDDFKKALKLGIDSDIVILGDAPELFIKDRILQNKHTFKYSERLLKQGEWHLLDPRELVGLWTYHTRYRKRNVYMLCTGGFTAHDLNLVLAYPGKKFKWGYFTAVEELDIEQLIEEKPKSRVEIIWTARFLKWKHPEMAVRMAYVLKKKGHNFHLSMIGTGGMYDSIRNLIQKLDVSENVSLLGSVSNSEVRSYMKKSNIFIFTSDRNEGWGVVVNEAMNYGCTVVASDKTGVTTYLLNHKQNGLVFKSGNLTDLICQTECLLTDLSLRNQLGRNAYLTLKNEWNPHIAATNLINLSESLLTGKEIAVKDGPCSQVV